MPLESVLPSWADFIEYSKDYAERQSTIVSKNRAKVH